ncbi:hypothetical protein MMA231_03320 [Asticcacaulis sp. MM231]|uniref:hypothetical protein n=1 Tax=Asticcacaulis sp. MM231 TaxID=3157666 RepID=UPI0032D56C2A
MGVLVLIGYFGIPLAATFSIVWFLQGLTRNLALLFVFSLIGALFAYSFSEYLRLSHGPHDGGMDAFFEDESAFGLAVFSIFMGISAAIGASASFILRYIVSKRSKSANLQRYDA